MGRRTLRAHVCTLGIVLLACACSRLILAQASGARASAAAVQSDQTAPAPSSDTANKTPADMYKEAMHPLDVVRGSLDNWSDAELGALAVGMHQAGEDCAKLKPADYAGEDLFELARLCTFGQAWNDANTAALDYVASRAEDHRTQAYALSVNALVHMNAIDLAVGTAREMLRRLPYDAETAYALRGLKDFLEQASNPIAATMAADEHPKIVAALALGVPLKATPGNAEMSVGALYESAMQLAFLERYEGDDRFAKQAAADVEGALPASAMLTAEDRVQIDAVSTRYQLLGTHLPEAKLIRSLQSPGTKVQINPHFGVATVLVLFPDWCVKCRRMMKTMTEFAAVNRDAPIHAYGLVFADDSVVAGQAAHEENFKDMRGTQTLVVPGATVERFGATDFPMGIVLDGTGTIRFLGAIPGTAFDGDSYIGKVIVRMLRANGGTVKINQKAK